MKAREFIPAEKPRNFVAKNAKMGGAGQHKDKKKAEKQGDFKHKNKQYAEGVNHSALQGWDEMNADKKIKALQAAGFKTPFRQYDWSDKEGHGQHTWSGWSSDELDDILHAAKVKALDQADELTMSPADRRGLQRQARLDFEEQRRQLHKEKMEMEKFAWDKANTEAERKHEITKIDKEYTQDLRKLQMSHMQDMEKILHADTHELNKMKAEFNMRQAEREKDKPKEPESKPDDERENNYDQDTGEPLKPGFSKPQQSNQWHTSQQVGYTPTKPSKKDNDDDITDVDAKPVSNKPLRIKEKISVVRDPAQATGIQRTGGITHGSVYAGKPQQSSSSGKKPNEAVDAKGRTQQQWMKLVKTKFPTARIAQAKMMNGPIIAYLDDGRKLIWKKAEQDVSEGLTELSNEKLAQYKKAAGADASAADKAGDYDKGNKRFKGIVKATNKQFANDAKKQK